MKFIVDNNVGRLAVWLRALGYDTLFINPIDDGELVDIALREKRVVLTKDVGVMQRRLITSGEVEALFIDETDWKKQLKEVVKKLKLRTTAKFTRCLACNAELQACDRSDAAPHVPPRVLSIQDEFFYCPSCQRYYWQGSHWQRMLRVIEGSVHDKE